MKNTIEIRKLLISIGLVLVLIATIFSFASIATKAEDKVVYAEWSGQGTGTAADPYLIGTKAQLEKFRDIINGLNGETQNVNACAKLTADIDLAGSTTDQWIPIGSYSSPYTGTFNGNGYAVSGIYIDNHTADSSLYWGFLGSLGEVGYVKNLEVSGYIYVYTYASGIVGYNKGTIESCRNNASIETCNYYIGGISAETSVSSVISKCLNTGSIKHTANTNAYVGGIVGYNDGAIVDSYNIGSINAQSAQGVGGITGVHGAETAPLRNCHNQGSITGPSGHRGGIATYYFYKAPESCYCINTIDKSIEDPASTANILTPAQFKDYMFFKNAGWDFDNIWVMGANYPVFGTSYGLSYLGNRTTSINSSGEGWSYDYDSNTLTLNGFNYDGDANYAFTYYKDSDPLKRTTLNVVISDTNNIQVKHSAIWSDSDLVLSGDGTLNMANTDGYMLTAYESTLTINSGTYNVSSCLNLFNANHIVINGGSFVATSTASSISGFLEDFTITNGTFDLTTNTNVFYNESDVVCVFNIQGGVFTLQANEGFYKDGIKVINAIKGAAWTNVEGTEGKIDIAENTTAYTINASAKMVQFPYSETPPTPPAPGPDETTPDETTPDSKRIDPDNGVTVETSDGTAIPEDITLKVVVKTEVTTQEGKVDVAKVQEKISSKEKIAKVYDVKLIRTVGGVEEEIQPSDIKEGMKVKVEIQLPKGVKANGLRILHVHNDGTIDEINNVTVANGVAVVEVASFSEFVLVIPASHGFCIGWVAFIFVILELLATALFVIIRFGLLKELVAKCKLDGAYGKISLLTLIGLCVSGAIFLFTLIALCVHQCAVTIITFILAFIICGGFTFLFLEDKGITKLLPKKVEDKPQE